MSRYRSARMVLAGAAVIALAGCGTPSRTSPATSNSSPAAATAGQGGSPSGSASAAAAASAAAGSGSAAGSSVAPSVSIPFPAAVGNTWVYEVVSSVNNAHALDTKKVLSLTRVTGGTRVTMSDTVSPGSDTAIENYLFYDNGQLGFPVSQPHGVTVVSGNGVVWPDAAGLASGRAYHSVLQIRLSSGQYETANVTVQGEGTTSVSVPAGTYRATLVTMTIASKVGKFGTTAVVKVWIASGTGPVKTEELVTAAGKTQLTSTESLLTFTEGKGRADGS
jgi:hypothetical protein